MFGIFNMGILNVLSKFKSQLLSYKQELNWKYRNKQWNWS